MVINYEPYVIVEDQGIQNLNDGNIFYSPTIIWFHLHIIQVWGFAAVLAMQSQLGSKTWWQNMFKSY
jgi:hypothetical protein